MDAISLNFSSAEITSRGTEQDSACQSDLSTMNSLQPCVWATPPAAILENSEKMGSSALPRYTPGSLKESFRTRTQSQNMLGASQEFRSASPGLGQSTTGFNQAECHSCRLRVYPWTNGQWRICSLPLSLLKSGQLPALLTPRAREHTFCVLGAWLCHLA